MTTLTREHRSRVAASETVAARDVERSARGEASEGLAPELQPRQIARDLAMVGGGTMVSHALGAVTALLVRVLLEPRLMGIWSVLKLVLSYGNYAGLGMSKGAAREIAIQHGRCDDAAGARVADLAFSFNTVTSLLYLVVVAAAAGWSAVTAGPLGSYWAVGLLTIGVLAVLQRFTTFCVQVLRAKRRFRETARLTVLEALVTLVAGGLGLWYFGLYGLLAGTAMTVLVAVAFLTRQGATTFRFRWDWPEMRRLLAVGAPLLVSGVALTLLQSLDRLMILAYLPDRELQLGCYSVATMVSNQLYGLAGMVGIVMYPRYHEHFGRTSDASAVARLARRVLWMMLFGLGSVALITAAAAPPILGWLLPAYRAGIPAMVALLPGTLFLACALPATHYCVAIGRQHRVVAITVAGLAFALAANYAVLALGGGITAVAGATSLAYGAYTVLMLVCAPGLFGAGPHCGGDVAPTASE